MQILKRIEQALYSTSVIYLLIELLGISFKELDIDLWIFSASGEVGNPELFPIILLVVCFLSFIIIFASRMPEFNSRFISIITKDARLLRKATEEVREEAGKDHSVSHISIRGLFNPSANLGIWMTSKGVWSAPIVLAINPITYLWLVFVSFIKTFFIKGGFFEQFFPTVFGLTPVLLCLFKYGQNVI